MTRTPAAHYKVDATRFSAVAICRIHGCGARWLTTGRREGLILLAAHVDLIHPGYDNVPGRRVRTA